LLLAAREVAAAALQHRLQHGKQLEDELGYLVARAARFGRPECRGPARRGQADAQVFLDREQRKDHAPLRNEADTERRAALGALVREVRAVERDRARVGLDEAHEAAE